MRYGALVVRRIRNAKTTAALHFRWNSRAEKERECNSSIIIECTAYNSFGLWTAFLRVVFVGEIHVTLLLRQKFSYRCCCFCYFWLTRKSINKVRNKSSAEDKKMGKKNPQWIFQWIRIKSRKIVSWQATMKETRVRNNSQNVLLMCYVLSKSDCYFFCCCCFFSPQLPKENCNVYRHTVDKHQFLFPHGPKYNELLYFFHSVSMRILARCFISSPNFFFFFCVYLLLFFVPKHKLKVNQTHEQVTRSPTMWSLCAFAFLFINLNNWKIIYRDKYEESYAAMNSKEWIQKSGDEARNNDVYERYKCE